MGYELDEFIRLAGFDPASDELDRIGAGGDVTPAGGQPGGDGLVVVTAYDDDGKKIEVYVASTKGAVYIRPRAT